MFKFKLNKHIFIRISSYSSSSTPTNKLTKEKLVEKFAKLNTRNHYDYLISHNPKIAQLPRASILVPISIIENGGTGTVFTLMQRAKNSRNYADQICFMGGVRDEARDRDEVETALREAREESGIVDPSRFTFLTKLCPFVVTNVGRDAFLLTPVVVYFERPCDASERATVVNLNKNEVEKLVEIETAKFLVKDENYEMHAISINDEEFYFHYFVNLVKGDEAISVWGITAYVAVLVSSFLNSREPQIVLDPDVNKLDPNDPNKFLYDFVLKKSANIINHFVKQK